MLDTWYLLLLAGFALSSWALLVLAERLMGGEQ